MKALIKEGRSLAVREVPRPELSAPSEVIVRVRAAGICRTDLYVAEGKLAAREPITLGHELAGVVEEAGSEAAVSRGDHVSVMPALSCGSSSDEWELLGVHRHGAFAEFVKVPASAVHRLPAALAFPIGAYAEPVAAALAVLDTGIAAGECGVIWGANRIARLTQRVLLAHDFVSVTLHDPRAATGLEKNAYDFAIESGASAQAMSALIRAVRPRGRIILKSRTPEPVAIDFSAAIAKQLSFVAAAWGDFAQAIALLAERRVEVGDLLGRAYALDDFEAAFRDAAGESSKPYFSF